MFFKKKKEDNFMDVDKIIDDMNTIYDQLLDSGCPTNKMKEIIVRRIPSSSWYKLHIEDISSFYLALEGFGFSDDKILSLIKERIDNSN